jgi:sodium-independent sulfate anion transporter 11
MSIVILLFRIARPRFWGLGRIPLTSISISPNDDLKKRDSLADSQNYIYVAESHPTLSKRVEPLPGGILMCRVDESFTYPNSSFISERIINYCKKRTRPANKILSKGDRQWNDDSTPELISARQSLPTLHAVIIDFASVNRLDSSGLQAIVDAQNALNRYAGHHIEFHFVNILHPAIRRCLIVANFGAQPRAGHDENNRPQEILPVVPVSQDGPQRQEYESNENFTQDIESSGSDTSNDETEKKVSYTEFVEHHSGHSITQIAKGAISLPKDLYPFFHWSADEAIRAASETLEIRKILEENYQVPSENTFVEEEPSH